MATPSTTAFGGLLRQHRVAARLTQEGLAERAGLSVYGVQKLEASTTQPYRDTAQRLALALALTAEAAEQFLAALRLCDAVGARAPTQRATNLTTTSRPA
jgi:transcriptional regulator with XRE-family HTH domain